MRRSIKLSSLAWVAVAFVAGALVFRKSSDESSERVTHLGPIILASIRDLGELRASRFEYQNVMEFETSRKPQDWLAAVPGGTDLVQASTRNKALVSFHGTVEAGVDLSKAQVEQRENGWVVKVPSIQVFRPNIESRVHRMKPGAFWLDPNLALKAQDEAARRFTDAAKRQGIEDRAKENVSTQIKRLVEPVANGEVLVEFSQPDAS